MPTHEQARAFAQDWISAWNAHDLDRVLRHYAEDFEMASPYIADIAGEPSGRLKGKPRVRAYWQAALDRIPDLHFELLEVFAGVDSLVIRYRSVSGRICAEVLVLGATGLVRSAVAHYGRE